MNKKQSSHDLSDHELSAHDIEPHDMETTGLEEGGPLSGLPGWFTQGEVIPLEDHLALVIHHETMRRIVDICREIAEEPAPVLLTGETGVGKSLLARFIHASRDPYAPFVSHITAGLEAAVLDARIFGGGSPAGDQPPLVEEADGGTLVLEEMGDLPAAIQEKLMRFWDGQSGEGNAKGPVIWICATNMPEAAMRAPGALLPGFLDRFRHVRVPPLRKRKQDIPAMVAYFSRLKSSKENSLRNLETLAKRLSRHNFPGNVRELESIVSLEAGGLPWRKG